MKDDVMVTIHVFFKSKIDFENTTIFTSNLRELKSLEQLSKIFHFSLFEKMKDNGHASWIFQVKNRF